MFIGPPVFGRPAPRVTQQIFPVDPFPSLEFLRTTGLTLYTFLIKLNLRITTCPTTDLWRRCNEHGKYSLSRPTWEVMRRCFMIRLPG